MIPEAYIVIISDINHDSASMIRSVVEDTKPFQITVVIHQSSALSPFLLNAVFDTVLAHIQDQPP